MYMQTTRLTHRHTNVKSARYVLGDPFDQFTNIGPVISHAAVKNVSEQITDALSKGATNRTPYNTSFLSTPKKGSYVAPCLLTNVNHSMRVMTSETFGPVIAVAAVDSDEEAIQLMNDSEYGLTASLWTKDIRAARKIIPRLDSGTVFVNRADYPSPVSPSIAVSSLRKQQALM